MPDSTAILHVDDDPAFADLTTAFLERENNRFSVNKVTSAQEGLECITEGTPDCIVSDYNMPGMDGLEFLEAVRETYPNLPFILFTGKGSEEVASDAIAAGVTDYIQKGSGSEQYALLANRIENAVESRREAKRANRQEQLMRLTEFAGDTGGFELETDTGEAVLTDGAHRILDLPEQANPKFEENLQYYHPDDRENLRQTIQRTLETGEQTHGTWRYQHPDGEKKRLDVTYTPVTANGDTTIIRGAISDITDRRERQRELRQLQQVTDNLSVPVTFADPSEEDETLVYSNNAFEEMTGYSREETVGRNYWFLQGENTDPEKIATLREAIDNEETTSVELRNYRKDGTEFWNRITVTPIYDDDGNLARYLGTQENITERKERERELRAERRFINQALHTLNDLFYVIDTDSTLQRWNSQLSELTGYTERDLADMEATELFPEDERGTVADAIATTLKNGEATADADLRTADGGRLPYELTGARLTDGDGTVTGLVGVGRDVTERKEREQKIDLVETLFEHTEECQFIVDVADGEFELCHANQHYKQTVGLSANTPVTGQTPTELFGETGGQRVLNWYRQCVETQKSVSYTVELPVPEEGTVYRTILTPVVTGGAVTHIVGTARNITDRIERQQNLEQYKTIVEALADAVYVTDEEGQFTYVSDEFVELVGYDRETIIGNTPSLIKDDDAVERAGHQLGRLLSSNGPETVAFEVEIHPREGDPVVCEDHMGVLPYDGEEFEGSVGILRDVTEQKEREAQLRETTKQLQDIIDTVEAAMWIRNEDNEFVYINQYYRDLFDIPDETDITGKHPSDLHSAEIAEQFQRNDQRVYEKREQVEIEETVETDTGHREFLTRIVPLFDDESVYATCGIATDITEQKSREQRLEQFTSIVSHDLRSPLNVAEGRLELAQESCESDHLTQAVDALNRSQALIDDLLNLAQGGETVGESERVELADVAERSWCSVETGPATLKPDTAQTLRADRSRLQELVENLCRNAVEHGGDDVTVSVGAMDDGFYVADTGTGIPESEREEIFEPGYSTNKNGTGFGLQIVQQIAGAHGWEVAVRESEQGGARFEFTGVELVD